MFFFRTNYGSSVTTASNAFLKLMFEVFGDNRLTWILLYLVEMNASITEINKPIGMPHATTIPNSQSIDIDIDLLLGVELRELGPFSG